MTYHVEKAPGSLHSLLWNLLTGYFDRVLTQGWLLTGCFDRGLRLTKRSEKVWGWRKYEYRSRSWWFNLNFSGLMHRIFYSITNKPHILSFFKQISFCTRPKILFNPFARLWLTLALTDWLEERYHRSSPYLGLMLLCWPLEISCLRSSMKRNRKCT